MTRKFLCLLALLLALVSLSATGLAQSPEELKFREKQSDQLHHYAAAAAKSGFPQVARRVWLMLLSEYATDHPEARAALGYLRVGNSWSLDPKFVYPKTDTPDPKAAKRLQDEWLVTGPFEVGQEAARADTADADAGSRPHCRFCDRLKACHSTPSSSTSATSSSCGTPNGRSSR